MESCLSLEDPMAQEFKWTPADLNSVLPCVVEFGQLDKTAVGHIAFGGRSGVRR